MLFIEIPRAMAGRGICIEAQKSNKPRKGLLKGKQMFVDWGYRERSFCGRKGQKRKIFGYLKGAVPIYVAKLMFEIAERTSAMTFTLNMERLILRWGV